MSIDSSEVDLLRQVAEGDNELLQSLLSQHREKLRRMVKLRIDWRLQKRVDASDVIQEAYIEAATRLPEFLEKPSMPFLLWLRLITAQKLKQVHRRHFGVKARDAGREIALDGVGAPHANSAALAAQLVGKFTAPSKAMMRSELKRQVREALDEMDEMDREILALRHFEQLTLAQAAQVLGIKRTAANNRYVRALKRFKNILADSPYLRMDPGHE